MSKARFFTFLPLAVGVACAAGGNDGTAPSGTGGQGAISTGDSSDPTGANGDGPDNLDLGTTGSPGGSLGNGSDVKPVDGQGCAISSATTELKPLYLIFLLDQSYSMGENQAIYDKRWVPVTKALLAFFGADGSRGSYASLTLFPNNANTGTGVGSPYFEISCELNDYVTPDVGPILLPDQAPFSAAIQQVDPPNEWGTPTALALRAAGVQARQLVENGKKVAVVLVTDGDPTACGEVDQRPIESAESAAAELADTAATYVIGVALDARNLDRIAYAGGTETASMVDTADPEATRDELTSLVRSIQGQQISCELPLPDPPQGETLDPGHVNVHLRVDVQQEFLGYNESCDGGEGWRYDDPSQPALLVLCPSSCETVRASSDAAVDVIFGCETKDIIVH